MDLTPFEFLTTLLSIVFIDLILAGDNAIVIGMAAKRLPKDTQKKAILYGTIGAILLRIVATVLVVYLLEIPWLLVAGGIMLLWIAYKLLVQEEDHDNVKASNTLWGSVWTIIVADAAMGLDNVIAVAGAAHSHTLLVVIGLLISIPIVVWGSTLFIKLLSKFPWIIYAGSAVLAYTASKMITHEPAWKDWFEDNQVVKWLVIAIAVVAVLGAGLWTNEWKKKHPTAAHE